MSNDYSENILVQNSAGNLLEKELGWEVAYAYNPIWPLPLLCKSMRKNTLSCGTGFR